MDLNKVYVIGDVHGCYYTLKSLIAHLPHDAELIFVGDLCDKGYWTKEVIDLVIEKGWRSLRGNHEDLMLKHIDEPTSMWANDPKFGGSKTLSSYGDDLASLERHLAWIKTLPTFIMIEDFFITHGFGLPYYQRRDEEAYQKALQNNRYSMKEKWSHEWETYEEYPIINIHGHDYRRKHEPTEHNIINLDTGCVYGYRLSAICLGNMEIITTAIHPRDRAQHPAFDDDDAMALEKILSNERFFEDPREFERYVYYRILFWEDAQDTAAVFNAMQDTHRSKIERARAALLYEFMSETKIELDFEAEIGHFYGNSTVPIVMDELRHGLQNRVLDKRRFNQLIETGTY